MTKRFILAVTLVIIAAGAASAYNLNFTLYNESGSTFREILLSPSWNDDFDRTDDLLFFKRSRRPLSIPHGQSESLNLHYSDERQDCRYWDLYVRCADGKEGMWKRIDLSTVVVVRIDRRLRARTFTVSDLLDMY
ncbi:MAG: hypothetical protein II877_10920 [Synergistaceae bacterium]|nr:hypothetical protein [Synergistaceae bacterium]MBQ6972498.1 hypothetical protein [Synergistaceae bacterium]